MLSSVYTLNHFSIPVISMHHTFYLILQFCFFFLLIINMVAVKSQNLHLFLLISHFRQFLVLIKPFIALLEIWYLTLVMKATAIKIMKREAERK